MWFLSGRDTALHGGIITRVVNFTGLGVRGFGRSWILSVSSWSRRCWVWVTSLGLRFEYPLAPPQLGLDTWNFDAFLLGFPRLLGRLGTVVIDRSVSDGRLLPSCGRLGFARTHVVACRGNWHRKTKGGPYYSPLQPSSSSFLKSTRYCMINHTGSDSIRWYQRWWAW